AGKRRRRRGPHRALRRRDFDLHHPRLPLPHRRWPDHQLPPAALDALHAGRRVQRASAHARRLRPRHRSRLPLLLLRRRQPALARAAMTAFPFRIAARDGRARTGVIETPRGPIRTPAFMPLGTAGTVKALTVEQVRAAGADIILGNTYHLMLRPTAERVARLGGLHAFMRWQGPILTDSGGFQVMSLSQLNRVTEEAVTFQSHIDGARHVLTPERSIEIQADLLGADIAMQLDECVAWPAEQGRAAEAMRLSARWAARCKAAFGERDAQALFGIQQGSMYEPLRRESAERLVELGFDGYAIGGLGVGEGHAAMCEALDFAPALLPDERP